MLKSDRGITLVYQGRQGSATMKKLTVESYIKWYRIYTVTTDRKVSILPDELHMMYESATKDIAWSDHIPTPSFCMWLIQRFPDEYEWDEPSLDMIIGRWHREKLGWEP